MTNKLSWIFIALLAIFAGAGMTLTFAPETALMTFVFVLTGWIISLCLHEYAHAATAYRFGDTTIAASGYLTLDPRTYFHGAGSLVLPVIALILGGVALPGGAVMVRTDLIRKPWQQSLVSLAGPAATLVCAAIVYAAAATITAPWLYDAMILLIFFLVMAFIINVLPIPGLDGFGAISPYLPASVRNAIPPQVGGLMMLGLLAIVFFFGFQVIMPVMRTVFEALGISLNPVAEAFGRFRFWSA